MGKWIGRICIFLGVLCLLGALGIVLYNRWEAERAAQVSQTLLADFQAFTASHASEGAGGIRDGAHEMHLSDDVTEPASGVMDTVRLDGSDCIGVLTIPILELELPVLTDWSYEKLTKAPCHYYGSYYGTDFVIAAHNYQAHFGRLTELRSGDIVVFTDVHGVAHYYEVVLLETLPKEATNEMITSGFGLSLYTCTPGGSNRVTVRCKAVKEK